MALSPVVAYSQSPLAHRLVRAALGVVVCAALSSGVTSSSAAVPAAATVAGRSAQHGVSLSWPIAPPHRIVRPFQAPPTRYAAGHRGIDIAAATGATVSAPADGEVIFAGRVVDRSTVTVDIGNGLLVSVEPVDATVPLHAHVADGAPLGTVSRGGHCDANCIHLGVRLNGEYVSPLLYLGGVERAILLPLADLQ